MGTVVSLRELGRGAEKYLRAEAADMGFSDMWEYRAWLADVNIDYIDELRASPGKAE
jgi:hypothetical protein